MNSNGAGHPITMGESRRRSSPPAYYAGKRLVVVGGTGFLGKVWVSMLLHRFPGIAHLYLLVRPKEEQTAEERFWSQIATSPVFDPIREKYAEYGGGSVEGPRARPSRRSSGRR